MKRNIIYTLLLAAALIFTACGSDSKRDPIPTDPTDVIYPYNLINATSIVVTTTAETQNVTIDLVDSLGVGIAGEEIKITTLPVAFGSFSSAAVQTDTAGRATFNYTPPAILPADGVESVNILFTDETENTITATINVTIQAQPFDLVNETTPVIVSHISQAKEISVYVVDQNNIGQAGKTVSISTIASGYGSIDSSTAVTDTAGKATFDYTGPETTDLFGKSTDVSLSFTPENDVPITKNVRIIIAAEAITSNFNLVNPSTAVDINASLQDSILDIQLIHTVDGYDIPVIDARPCTTATNTLTTDCVIPVSIPRECGRITDAAGSNAQDGYIYFNYLGPIAGEEGSGICDIDVLYINEDGEIAATNTMSVNIVSPF